MKVLAPPKEHPIFCNGQRTVAWFDHVNRVWKCARCGSDKVKVAW